MNVVDSSGWLEYFADGPNAFFFAPAITQTDALIVPAISLYEVFKRVLQQCTEADALQAVAVKGSYMKSPDEEFTLHIHPRAKETVSLEIPTDTLDTIKKVAASRDMSYQALLKLYIGQGLRQDVTKLFADRVLETTAQVLARHIQSEEEVAAILREIQSEVAA